MIKPASFLRPAATPRVVHRFVIELCDKISPGSRPLRIPVQPICSALLGECFPNVRQKIKNEGGGIQHGWAIAERAGLFIEAEFHGVWIGPSRALIDVTPKRNGETATLFLPDPNEVFDKNALHRRANVQVAEYDHPAVHKYLSHAAALRQYEEDCTNPHNPREMIIDRKIHRWMFAKLVALEFRMLLAASGRNALCHCGSGQKFKGCCGVPRART